MLDAWIERLRAELKPRGTRTDLARFIAVVRGGQLLTWQNALARFLRRDTRPSAEVLLTVEQWLKGRKHT